ncbi:hypothetical protein CDV55_100878 [Aspergillus turcosus]|nr:hypothetical protein CDV55_100878 [Aspergillus turcosus]
MIAADESSREGMTSSVNGLAFAAGTAMESAEPQTMPIAIIGMSCRFPGDATTPEKLWDLCARGKSAWSPISRSRFNREAWYHPNKGHIGTSDVKGAHYLTEDVTLFDASFFNFSAEIARTMDPEVRLQLETVYEALENAGIPMEEVAGTNTSVFAGTSFRDNHDSHMRDPSTMDDAFFVTGNGAAMVANRVSHFYDLRGPSVMVDTGCSTSLTLLHLACQSLRTGESTMSIVGGSNVLLNPDMFIAGTKLGIFSAEGKCFTFDSRAAGYGRGDGIATIIIKPLSDALRDGNPIRAVIRNTAANQDGKTTTITSPSQEAQQQLFRECYQKAGLDPVHTAYVEAHGTGTQTGDTIEANAIGTVFCEKRDSTNPLRIGSVKTNIGHTEATSGLAGVIKAVMAIEKGYIPPSINFEKVNPKISLDNLKLKIPLSLEPWPSNALQRVSVNNFGYGGANAHVIIEHPDYLLAGGHQGASRTGFLSNPKNRSRVFVWSAKDETAAKAIGPRLREYLNNAAAAGKEPEEVLDRLALTLGQHRSHFAWNVACSAESLGRLVSQLGTPELLKPRRTSRVPRLGFVFTGQGAQWFAMGRELIGLYPVFRDTLRQAEAYLHQFGATWSLIEELTRSESESRVNEVTFSLPLSVAIQLALVDLLRSWGIHPTGVTGHSSGEVGAAYAAKAIDLKSAMAIVYSRGHLTTQYGKTFERNGGMIAVGLSREEAQEKIARVQSGQLVVACVNSPVSVTVSGDVPAILELEQLMAEEKVFARRLKVNAAYHSHHMVPVAEPYREALARYISADPDFKGDVIYSSPTTGDRMSSADEIASPEHWVRNMVQPVEFLDSLQNLCLDRGNENARSIDMLIEVGPHGALGGPIRQTLMLPELKEAGITYATCLKRGESAVQSMHNLVCTLVQQGYRPDLGAVNFPYGHHGHRILTDLPPYPWNHQTSYWKEPRINKALREKTFAPHDLLGRTTTDFSPLTPTWRHIIRPRDIPWVCDHVVQSSIIYPGAGYICMAIEAVRQMAADPSAIAGYKLEAIDIISALVLEANAEGVEVRLSLLPPSDSVLRAQSWQVFHIQSLDLSGKWVLNCEGRICVITNNSDRSSPRDEVSESAGEPQKGSSKEDGEDGFGRRVDAAETYQSLNALGLSYGKMFQNLVSSRTAPGRSSSILKVADTAASMPYQYEQSHVVHPTTLDTVFQAVFLNLPPAGSKQRNAMVPKTIKSLYVSADISSQPGHLFEVRSHLTKSSSQGFESCATILDAGQPDQASSPVLTIDGLFCQSVGSAAPTAAEMDKLCFKTVWKPDVDLIQLADLSSTHPVDPVLVKMGQDIRAAALGFMADAVQALAGDREPDARQSQYLEWIQNTIGQKSPEVLPISEPLETIEHQTELGALVCQIGRSLPAILTGQLDPMEIVSQHGLNTQDPEAEEDPLWLAGCFSQIRAFVDLFGHKKPRANILEIGAGRGRCTKVILEALSPETEASALFARYDATDPLSEVIEATGARLEGSERVRFQPYDIESDPTTQGFEANSYDLIVASPVLYTAQDVEQALARVRSLLKPGGKLLIWGPVLDSLAMRMVYGTLSGWQNHSLSSLLQRAGFEESTIGLADSDDQESRLMSITVATAKSELPPIPPSEVVLVHSTSCPPEEWLNCLTEAIVARMASCKVSVQGLTETEDLSGKFVLFLGDLTEPVLDQPTPEQFESLKSLLSYSQGVLWVSQGSQMDSPKPFASLHHGLLRTLRCENTAMRYLSLDLDPTVSVWDPSTAGQIARILSTGSDFQEYSEDLREAEYAIRAGVVQIPRVRENLQENNAVAGAGAALTPELCPFFKAGRNIKLGVTTPGLLESLTFIDDPRADETLPEDYVEINPKAFGLNFRDVLVALDQLEETRMGFECSGVISRVGSKAAANGFKIGDRVYAFAFGCFTTTVRVSYLGISHIPEGMDFETAASIPLVYGTAYYGLHDVARLAPGETVLIHCASGGVGQAAIMMAQYIGAEIFVTVGTAEKRQFIMETYGIAADHIFSSRNSSFASKIMAKTGGRGVDVVLNSLAGPLLRETWRCIATFGRFIEIGKRDIEMNNSIEMAPFARQVSFSSLDLVKLGEQRPHEIARILSAIFTLLSEKKVRAVTPINVFPLSDAERAFRIMQEGKHLGKIILSPEAGDLVKVLPSTKSVKLSPEASYLIVGGLGGIGKSVSNLLVERGARHLILLSRNAASPKPESEAFVRQLRMAGANVVLKSCSIADQAQLSEVIADCARSMPPIKGVIQSAMVLRDSIFEHMSWSDYNTAIQPKVQGTWNLHKEFENAALDFFVILSSISGFGGNSGQANYAAGGTFQDALARYRASLSLPAVSLDLGMVKSVGVVAETKQLAEHLSRLGLRPLEEDEVLRLIESAIRDPQRNVHLSQVTTGIPPSFVRNNDSPSFWNRDIRFAALERAEDSGSSSPNPNGGAGVGTHAHTKALIAAATTFPDAIQRIQDAFIKKLADTFARPESEIDPALPLTAVGVDSLIAVELRNWLVSALEADCSIFDVMQSPSLAKLAEKVASKSRLVRLEAQPKNGTNGTAA